MSKTSVAAVAALSTIVLGVLTNPVAAHPAFEAWCRENFPLVLAAFAALVLVATLATAFATVEQASGEGDALSGMSMAGVLVTAAVSWGVGGGVLGWAAQALVWPWAQEVTPGVGAAAWAFVIQAGPLHACCVAMGFLAGERLKFADAGHQGSLSLAGSIAGAAAGFVTASWFSLSGPVSLGGGVAVPVGVVAPAAVGAAVGAFTGAFRPRVERQKRRAQRLEAQANERRAARWEAEAERFERAAMRLRGMGCEVRTSPAPGSPLRLIALDLLLNHLAARLDAPQKAQIKRIVHGGGTFDEVVERIADLAVAAEEQRRRPRSARRRGEPEAENPERRARIRQELVDTLYADPTYRFMKMGFEFLTDAPLDGGPRPPYVVLDPQGREYRLATVAALASCADELALHVPGAASAPAPPAPPP